MTVLTMRPEPLPAGHGVEVYYQLQKTGDSGVRVMITDGEPPLRVFVVHCVYGYSVFLEAVVMGGHHVCA